MDKRLIIVSIIMLLVLPGCWDSQPIEDTFLVTAIGIDISEENPNFITVSAFGPSFIQEAKEPYIVFTSEATNIGRALEHIRNKTYRNVSISHTMVVLFSEEIARNGIRKYLDVFIRNAEIGSQLVVAITQGRAVDYLNIEVKSNPDTADFITGLLETEARVVEYTEYTLRGVVNKLNERYPSLILPYLTHGTGKNPEITANQAAIFKKDKLVGVIGQLETLPLLHLRGSLKRGTQDISRVNPKGDGSEVISLRVYPERRKVKMEIEDEDVIVNLNYNIECDIYELEPPEKDIDDKTVNQILNKAEEQIERRMMTLIKKIQEEYKVDAFNLSEHLRVQYPEYYKRVDWNDVFQRAKFKIQVKMELRQVGLTK